MISIIVSVVVGVFIGWHLPQPSWVAKAETKVVEEVKKNL